MIVWIASYPRSGNRLCRATIRGAFGQRTASAGSAATLRNDLGELLDSLGVGPDDDPLPALRDWDETIFVKTHSLPQHLHWLGERGRGKGLTERLKEEGPPRELEDSPALYLVRDGRDCLISYAHFTQEIADRPKFRSLSHERAIARLMRRNNPYGGWSKHVRSWRERPSTQFIRFEDLIEDPVAAIAAGAEALGIDLPEPQSGGPSFEEMRARSRKPELVRRGRKEGWRTDFPPALTEEFWERHGDEMDALGDPRE